MSQLTPMQQQWADAKRRAKDAILLFRMGDFYELFADDAVIAAPILELALTSRDKDKGESSIPMAGFPHHSAPAYIARLIAQGLKVAICDQIEDPKATKGLVKRDITRIVTPGTVSDDAALNPRSNNYLVGIIYHQSTYELAALDWSTGEFRTTSHHSVSAIIDEIGRLSPSELLLADNVNIEYTSHHCRIEKRSHKGNASSLILDYVNETQGGVHGHIREPRRYSIESHLLIDAMSREHLNMKSLLSVVDKTKTAMGGRQLVQWLFAPSSNLETIQTRHDIVEAFVKSPHVRNQTRSILAQVYDLERLTAKVTSARVNPRELGNLRNSLSQLPDLIQALHAEPKVSTLFQESDFPKRAFDWLDNSLADDLPISTKDGGVFKSGYDALLDELSSLSSGGREQIAAIEQRERDATGISSLKIKYTRVFGYYIEITRTHLDKVPEHYKRKQTIATGERYVTPELMELEERVASADLRRQNRDAELFEALREKVSAEAEALLNAASKVAQLDTLAAFAEIADEQRYIRPHMLPMDMKVTDLSDARHPVVEVLLQRKGEPFVPNSVRLDASRQLVLMTGPNMAGKSTIMRQVALSQILAQAGSFVPAKRAELSICDRIFTRVGASDDLQSGRSTFMVEMSETAHILHNATPHSLVILDEIGRGTSTFDGLSLAWAVAEYLHDHLGARTMFATHYHELVELSNNRSSIKNMQVAVAETNNTIKFLYTLIEGAAEQSYGIHVARLAGLPETVLHRAEQVLISLEKKEQERPISVPARDQLSLFVAPVIDDNKINVIKAKVDELAQQIKKLQTELDK